MKRSERVLVQKANSKKMIRCVDINISQYFIRPKICILHASTHLLHFKNNCLVSSYCRH